MTKLKDCVHNTATAAQDDSGVVVSCGELQLLQAELDDVTDALLNLSARLHEAAGFIDTCINRQAAVTSKQEG